MKGIDAFFILVSNKLGWPSYVQVSIVGADDTKMKKNPSSYPEGGHSLGEEIHHLSEFLA